MESTGDQSTFPDRTYHVDGELVPADEATVSVHDRGFAYGDAVFETVRVYGGEPFRWESHLDRLDASCEALSLPLPVSRSTLRERVDTAVREQVALFSRADLVVGPHGAGLTNVVFGEDLAVVELFGDKQIATFDRLAAALGHGYEYLEGEGVGVDIRVDTDVLDRTIARVLEGEPTDRTGS